jgi:hypothetical protein
MPSWKNDNGKLKVSNKEIQGWNSYNYGNEPQEMINLRDQNIQEKNNEIRNSSCVEYNGNYFCESCLLKLTAVYAILENPADTFTIKDYYNNDITINKSDIRAIIELIINK